MEMLEVRAAKNTMRKNTAPDDAAEAHAFEDLGNGDEHERGAGVQGLGGAAGEGEHGGNDHEARESGNEGIHEAYAVGGLFDVDFLLHVGAVGDENAHAYGQREEELSAGRHHGHDGELGEVRHQVVVDAGARAGTGHGIYGHDDGENEQQGHHDARGALHAAFHALENDAERAAEEDEVPDDGFKRGGNESAEVAVGSNEVHVAHHVFEQIFDDPSADEAVVGQNEHGHDGVYPAAEHKEGIALHLAEGAVGSHGAESCLSAETRFGHDERVAEGEHENEIDQQEDASSVLGGEIGESPDVSETYGRTGHGENKTYVAGKEAAGTAFA